MILITGRFQIKPEHLDDFLEFAHTIIPPQRMVNGCVSFDILQDITQENRFVMMEIWEDREVLEEHFETEAYAQADAILNQMLSDEPLWEEYEV